MPSVSSYDHFADDAKDVFSSLRLDDIITLSFIALCLQFPGRNSQLKDFKLLAVTVQRNLKSAWDAVKEDGDRATV